MRSLWLATTADALELPIAVADTGTQLAKMLGCDITVISKRKRKTKENRFIYSKVQRFKVYEIKYEDGELNSIEDYGYL